MCLSSQCVIGRKQRPRLRSAYISVPFLALLLMQRLNFKNVKHIDPQHTYVFPCLTKKRNAVLSLPPFKDGVPKAPRRRRE